MKKLMILGGGLNQIPLIECAKRKGYSVILCDYAKDCPGREIADKLYIISTTDYNGLLEVAQKEKVNGIVSNSEPVMHIVSALTDELGLPSISLSVMKRFLDKNKMREWLTPLGLSDVKYCLCNNVDEALEFWKMSNCKKMIMKPLDSSASRGVFSITSEEDIIKYFDESMEHNRKGSAVLLEEYIDGVEFTVDGICIDGKHTTLAISKKKHYSDNENVAYELFFSYKDEAFNYDELRKLNDKIVEGAGLNFGMTHSEYKYSNGKFHLIEVAARGGGAFIATKIVPYLMNYDTVGLYIDSAVDINAEKEISISEISKSRVAVLEFFDTPNGNSGVVKSIKGLDFLKENEMILEFKFNFKSGDFIRPAKTDAERIGYYIAVGESKEQLLKLMDDIEKKVIIEFEGEV